MNVFKKLIISPKTLLVPVLATFLFFSGSTVNAQEKEGLNIKSTTIEYHINKNTKDSELDEIKKEVNNEKIANLSFSNIKRNEKGELISLKTSFRDERGSSQQKSEYNSNGIADFTVKIHQNEAGERYLELGNRSNSMLNIANDPQAGRALYSEQANDEFEEFFAQDFMQLMKGMQEDMKAQQDMFINLLREHEEALIKEKSNSKEANKNK
ncbi:hypothetical protein HX045_05295 [Myroides odoratimimus]|uniref:hypothetical protein n=1 Tax=Myroides odoratimimus TaxID=76832 RepID=UPI00257554E7|nr:hypothetical protein [Myroides odoratimimus]MDM1443025.1 hypothetical protein [Myroides odoratimimus]MDM1448457.1 hypothetical protein [Myroides odoratimimus]MDM1453563.1 hypothetical protein [Myroides odoratimimus]MDM1466811.1 hypothetical protein [Myroides odoratimimus]MDM1469679.1 hypothetical protein [Myroides odoratimimus]